MRISDWSSDVCSSDLRSRLPLFGRRLSDRPTANARYDRTELRRPDARRGPGSRADGEQYIQAVAPKRTWDHSSMRAWLRRNPCRTLRKRLPRDRCRWALEHTGGSGAPGHRSEEHTSELQSLMRISYAVFCLQTKTQKQRDNRKQ